jgi:hypothetical protein
LLLASDTLVVGEKKNIAGISVDILAHFKLNLYLTWIIINNFNETSNGRPPLNINSGISQHPFIGSCSNSKLELI